MDRLHAGIPLLCGLAGFGEQGGQTGSLRSGRAVTQNGRRPLPVAC
jgi:hypothetical protein